MKYYYTDALAASWMEKHHGMTFWTDTTVDSCPEDANNHRSDTAYEADISWRKRVDRKYYIHPDSVAILEPQTGDAFRTLEILRSGEYDLGVIESKAEKLEFPKVKGFRIIERNGIAFMWPEVEE